VDEVRNPAEAYASYAKFAEFVEEAVCPDGVIGFADVKNRATVDFFVLKPDLMP
jgi:hypothetical protein